MYLRLDRGFVNQLIVLVIRTHFYVVCVRVCVCLYQEAR